MTVESHEPCSSLFVIADASLASEHHAVLSRAVRLPQNVSLYPPYHITQENNRLPSNNRSNCCPSDFYNRVQNASALVDFSPLQTSIVNLVNSSLALDASKTLAVSELDGALAELHKHPKSLKAIIRAVVAGAHIVDLNKKLSSFELGFIDEGGIKDREWYRNLIVAPGKWTGTQPRVTQIPFVLLRLLVPTDKRLFTCSFVRGGRCRVWRDNIPGTQRSDHVREECDTGETRSRETADAPG